MLYIQEVLGVEIEYGRFYIQQEHLDMGGGNLGDYV
jgi:hypothetical protein